MDLPMLEPVVVDWRDDPTTRALAAGEVITIRGQKPDGSVAAAPGDPCNFNYECNDCNLCTVDECGEGVCEGGVRDGFACDINKDCQGICDVGDHAGEHCYSFLNCCSERPGIEPHGDCVFFPCVELESEQCVNTPIPDKCDGGARDQLSCECTGDPPGTCTGNSNTTCVGGNRDGERCDCPDGTCGLGFERGAECDDDLWCNGYETCANNECIAGTAPLCEGLTPVCDDVTDVCIEKCVNDLECNKDGLKCTGDVCDLDSGECDLLNPCGPGGTCTEGDPVVCDPGRCCDVNGVCTAETHELCLGAWTATTLPCEDYSAGQPNICPAYGSGIAPQGDYIVEIGPLTSSAMCPGYDIERLGDDYTADPNVVAGEYMDIEILRIAMSVQVPARFAIEFWDVSNPADPLFIEDTFYPSGTNAGISGLAIHTVLFDPPLTIPTSGVVAISIATNFGPLGSISWLSTDEDGSAEVDVGTNSDTTMFVEGSLIDTGFLGQCSGGDRDGLYCDTRDVDADCPPDGTCVDIADVLAFEMITTPAGSPVGACCVAVDGSCADLVLPWVCEDQGNVFLGSGTACNVCMLDPFNMQCFDHPDCKICVGTGFPVPPDPGVIVCVDNSDCTPDGECTDFGPCLTVPPTCTINACCNPVTGECAIGFCDGDPLKPCEDLYASTDCDVAETCLGACPDGWTDLLYGTSCVPDCCEQPTPSYSGGDTCFESVPTIINVPLIGEDPNTVTITGSNSGATFDDWNQPLCEGGSNEDQPCDPDADCDGDDTCTGSVCEGVTNPGKACDPDRNCLPDGTCTGQACTSGSFNPEGTTLDPGWWESFSIDACANVRVDLCCSAIDDPISGPQPVRPAWAGMYGACPCDNYQANDGVPPPIGIGLGTPGYARGGPFCDDDNLWMTFGPVPAGVYHYPIYSAPRGTFASPPGGTYQFHVTVGACSKAACCGSVCVGGARDEKLCNSDPIPECPNGTCTGQRQVCEGATNPGIFCTTIEDCELPDTCTGMVDVCVHGELHGYQCDSATGALIQCPGGTCSQDTGCDVVNEPVCDAMGGFWLAGDNLPEPAEGENPQPVVSCGSGTELDPYVCATGSCCVGPGDCQDEDGAQCTPVCDEELCEDFLYGEYIGGAACDWRQPEGPCPVCPAASYPENCQGDEEPTSGYVFAMDRKYGTRVADDFVAGVTEIGQFCFAPCFIQEDEFGANIGECTHYPEIGVDPPPDAFEIHFYEDDHGLPGAELAASAALDQPVDIAAKAWWGPSPSGGNYRCWDYAVLFDPPLGGFEIGETYWIAFSGQGRLPPPEDDGCTVFLHGALDGNGWALRDYDHLGSYGWGVDDALGLYENEYPEEFSFCIDGGFQVPPPITGACCYCNGTCANDVRWEDCLGYVQFVGTDEVFPRTGRFAPMRTCGEILCEDLGAAGGGCPGEPSPFPGEQCENPLVIGEGPHLFSNLCSATDPPASYPVCDNQNDLEIMADQWYHYHACDSDKRIDIDLCGSDFDTVIAVYTNGTDTCPVECPPPLDLLTGGICRDRGCPFGKPTTSAFASVDNQCFVIRVGGYAGPSTTDYSQGAISMEITCGGCFPSSPAEAETVTYPGDPPAVFENQKMRYLSFSAGDQGKSQAVRVTFKDLPSPYDGWNDVEMWVQQPATYCENAGKKNPPCPPALPATDFLGATLGCNPWYGDFESAGVIHVFHEGIVPNGTYWVEVADAGCDYVANPDESFSTPLGMTQSTWGDVARSCAPCPCTPPDGVVNVASDVTAVLNKFRNLEPPNATCAPVTKARADHDWETPNQLVDISDCTFCLDAFRGVGYPPPAFAPPGPRPCP